MKTSVSSVILLTLFALCAYGGEVERFIRETLEEQRARNATESSEVGKIIDDAIKGQKMPELELPKESVFTSKDKERDARYYKYDKTGKLISVEYAAKPEKNEYYAYDRQGNIIEKRMGDKVYKYTYDTGNQLKEMSSPEGKREYFYDRAGRLVSEKLNGEIDVEYKYGYLDKVIEVNRRGKITKFAYDGFGMLAQKTFHDGSTEVWVWDGLALIRRGSDIYVNEPHVSGGVPILSKTDEGVRYHEHDFLGTTLWSMDTKGNLVKDYQDTTIFGEGSIQKDRSARFTGKPYDEDLQAYVFPYRNYDEKSARWRSSDPAGYPDGVNGHFYAGAPTMGLDVMGTAWGDLNFVEHFYFGNSRAVNLSETGLSSAVENSAINKGIKSRFGDQILMAAEQTAPATGDFRQTFANSYNFGDVCFSIRNASMYGFFDGTVSLVETLDNGMALYSYSGNATINFLDTFTDPLSVIEYIYGSSTSPDVPSWLLAAANVGGMPYDIYGGFTWAYKGTFEK